MAAGFIQVPPDSSGKKLRTNDRGSPGHDQYVIPTDERLLTFRGRAASFRIPGRAGTTGQRLFAIHNATASAVIADVYSISVDLYQTVVKAITVPPPIVRLHRFTAVPANGAAVPKVPLDTAESSSSSITAWQDASADGTSAGTALAITIPSQNIIAEEFAPRYITAVGYEVADRMTFVEGYKVRLRSLQGVVVELVYTLATQNPTTDMWSVTAQWDEFTLP